MMTSWREKVLLLSKINILKCVYLHRLIMWVKALKTVLEWLVMLRPNLSLRRGTLAGLTIESELWQDPNVFNWS